jgi:hypothetical protein
MKQIGFALFSLTVFSASLALPQDVASKKTTSKKTTSKKTVAVKKGKSSKKSGAATSRQMAPTPDRYRDIQQSLVAKGYLKSEPNGVWDDRSIEALKQFQTDQKLTPTGKISSATLIALGLGPKTADKPDSPEPAPQ